MKELPLLNTTTSIPDSFFTKYEAKFKAFADQKRLKIMYVLTQRGKVSVSDLSEIMEMPQSKLSYHLKILLDANFLKKEEVGTFCYYEINQAEVNHILSEELCCVFRPNDCC
ncbi:ArsR/SmtB family transcription factor [Brevibacillus sp. SYSU BS000544]|uniref:ArsR/SmtB family transcription factor n=1 Tax=Brevibacillus sp. SYSU BS000544 TaxID=3416443 RepID=UPI003CE5259E